MKSTTSANSPNSLPATATRSRRCENGCTPMSASWPTKKGMIEAIQLVAHGSSELKAYSFERLTDAIGLLLNRAVAAGEVRSDISAEDLLRTLVGIFYSQGATEWHPTAQRLVDVFVDGLRKR